MNNYDAETIANIATPIGKGGISIIKISGVESKKIVESLIFSDRKKKRNITLRDRTISFGYFISDKGVSDEIIILYFKGPKSYTGEDVVEIQCHGGEIITNLILREILLKGARLSKNGEFSKRAVLNGKMDIIKAESIMDIINAESEDAVYFSSEEMSGRITQKINKIITEVEKLKSVIMMLIDFPEEEDILTKKEIQEKLKKIGKELDETNNYFSDKKESRAEIRVVFTGKPNVGKSSLFNKIVGRNRAIVNEEAGTTRDIIEERININGKKIVLIDTAGLRSSSKGIEKEGIKRAKKEIENAHIVVNVLDGSKGIGGEEIYKNKIQIDVYNKSDILKGKKEKTKIYSSVKRKNGERDLVEAIKNAIEEIPREELVKNGVANIRQEKIMKEVMRTFREIKDEEKKNNYEIVEEGLRQIENLLKELIGEKPTEEDVDKIFERFCIGK